MTLEEDENYEETPSEALTPGVRGMEAPMQTDTESVETKEPSGQPATDSGSESNDGGGLSWLLPNDSDKDGEGRRGFLSTYTEVHAIVTGVTAGAHFGLSGDAQIINDVVGLGIAGDRARQAELIPDKYRDQAKSELPTFLAGVALGYAATRTNVFAELGVGV